LNLARGSLGILFSVNLPRVAFLSSYICDLILKFDVTLPANRLILFLELLTVVTWQKHVKNVLERISKLCSERDIQLNLLKNKAFYIGGGSPEASSDPM
jgi:hypothetical protein